MAKFQPERVHVIKREKDPFSNQQINRLAEFHGCTFFTQEEQRYAVQDGEVFGLGGARIDEPPAWLLDRLEAMSDVQAAECGAHEVLKVHRSKPQSNTKEPPASKSLKLAD